MEYQVLPGHSVVTDKTYLPGEAVELSDKEGKRLIGAGIVAKVSTEAVEPPQKTPKPPNVGDTVKLVEAAQNTDDLAKFAKDERKGVIEAVQKRGQELAAAASE